MTAKLRWGILSSAKIARTKLIPAIACSALGKVVAIGSRTEALARATAEEFGIERAYDSYEALLADPEVDAIYNPLPNDLHVYWSIKALQAGKHVLCEKPLGLHADDVKNLIRAAEEFPHLKAMEGFMYRFHPQWLAVKKWIVDGLIGDVRAVQAHFTYNNHEPLNIRNNPEAGGGALMDIGCYGISAARWIFNEEPVQVIGQLNLHPEYRVDRLGAAILQFPSGGMATVLCSTKTESGQGIYISGTAGSITLERPWYCVDDEPNRVFLRREGVIDEYKFDGMDHYRFMTDSFAQSVFSGAPVATPLQDALANMQVIDSLFRSANSGGVESVSV